MAQLGQNDSLLAINRNSQNDEWNKVAYDPDWLPHKHS